MVTVTLRHLPAYLSALVPMVEIAYRLSPVIHSVVDDMQVRVFFVLMQYGHVLGILDTHLFHVFPCVFCHFLHGKFCPVLVAPAYHGVPYGIAKLWAHLSLCVEVGNDGFGVVIPNACRIQNRRLFPFQQVTHATAETLARDYLSYHPCQSSPLTAPLRQVIRADPS